MYVKLSHTIVLNHLPVGTMVAVEAETGES